MPIGVRLLRTLTGHASAVYALSGEAPAQGRGADNGTDVPSASPTPSPTLLAGDGSGMVVRWRLDREDSETAPAGQLVARMPGHAFSILPLPGRRQLLTGGLEGGVHLMQLPKAEVEGTQPDLDGPQFDGKELRNLGDNRSAVFAMAWQGARQRLWVGHGDGMLSIWDGRDWSPEQRRRLAEERIRCMAFSPEGERLAVGSSDGMLQILDAARGETIARLDHEEASVFCTAWDPRGRYLLTGAIDARLRVWMREGEDFRLDEVIPAHTFTINALAFHPEGRWFATGSRDRSIKLWDADTIGLAKVLERPRAEGHQHSVNALLWHPYQNLLISGSDDRTIKLWQMEEDAIAFV